MRYKHNLYLASCIIIIFVMTLVMCSCDAGNTADKNSIPDGYTIDAISGGENIDRINIYDIIAQQSENSLKISISIKRDSDITGSGSAKVNSFAKYNVFKIDSPYAIAVSIDETDFTEYKRNADFSGCSYINGSFFDERTDTLYFRLTENFAFKVKESAGTLTIYLEKMKNQRKNDEFAYYVTSNLYDFYQNGENFIELMPTIARNGNMMMISKGYDNKKDAEMLLQNLGGKYPNYKFDIVAVYYNELPIYNYNLDYAVKASDFIECSNGVSAECIVRDGLFITKATDGLIIEKTNSENGNTYSEIFEQSTKYNKRLIKFEFANIEKVKYSPDKRKLAVLENSVTGSHLYIFDSLSGELLYDLSDAGFGKRISGFVWNELGTAVYAISGTSSIEINMYDFSVTDETKRKSVIYSNNVDEGSFELYNGNLYYCSSDENGSKIYSVRPQLGVVKEVCKGSAFAFSNNNMAVSTASTVTTMETGFSFFVEDMKTGKKTQVTDKFAVYDFLWSENGKYLFYIENRQIEDGAESDTSLDNYKYSLYRYDTASEKSELLANLSSYSRLRTIEDDVVVLYYDVIGQDENESENIIVNSSYQIKINH